MKNGLWLTALIVSLSLQAGCSSVSSKLKSLAFSKPDPSDPLAYLPDEADDSYKTAKRKLDNGEDTLLKFAKWREDLGDYAEARQQYTNILAENPDCADARIGMARVEYATGRVSESVKILEVTAQKFPDRADTWAELGRIQSEREEWGQAVQSLTKAVELSPESQGARYQLGIALARSDRFDEARSHLTFAVGESAALYNIGYVLTESGRADEAALWVRRALNAHPDERTRTAAARMLAELSGERSAAPRRQPNTVDVALTTFREYREVPGQSGAGQTQPDFGQNRSAAQGIPASTANYRRTEQGPTIAPQTDTTRSAAGNYHDNNFNAGQRYAPQQPSMGAPVNNVGQNGIPGTVPQWRGPSAGNDRTILQPSNSTQPQQWRGPSQ